MLPLRLAVRFLRAGRGQTVLIIVGISIAVAAQIFVGLLINSLQLTLVDRTIGNQPQITVSSATDNVEIQDWETDADIIDNFDQFGYFFDFTFVGVAPENFDKILQHF